MGKGVRDNTELMIEIFCFQFYMFTLLPDDILKTFIKFGPFSG